MDKKAVSGKKLKRRAQLVADPSECIITIPSGKMAVTFELIMRLKKSLRIYTFLKVFHVVYFMTVCFFVLPFICGVAVNPW